MDPISGVASLFAIISLAVQLGETAIKLKTFLDSILDAPAEVKRLRSSVTLFINVNEHIRKLLGRQKCQVTNLQLIHDIHQNLEFCRQTLESNKSIRNLVDGAKNELIPALRVWASIGLAWRKEQLRNFSRELEFGISLLNMHLIVNVNHLQVTANSNIEQLQEQFAVLSNIMISEKLHASALAGETHSAMELMPKSSAPIPLFHGKSSPGKMREWHSGKGLQFRYCQVGGDHGRYSISAIVQVYGLHVVQVQINVPDLRHGLLPSSLISLRNLIPQNAAIITACKTGNSTGVKQLLVSGKARPNDVTLENCTALSTAIKHNQLEIVQLLLQSGADPNLPVGELQSSPIQIAVAHNNPQIALLLMRYDADLQYCSAGSWSLFHYLFSRDRLSSIDEYYDMFRNHVTFDGISDSQGWTALHRCAAFGTAHDVYMLVKLGASRFSGCYTTTWGRSPFHIAALMNNISTLQALVELATDEHGARDGATQQRTILETPDNNGWTPLHLAIQSKAMDTAKWLLGKKVDVHKETYLTAMWFPRGRMNDNLSVVDVAKLAGKKVLNAFSSLLIEAGYDITRIGKDIYFAA